MASAPISDRFLRPPTDIDSNTNPGEAINKPIEPKITFTVPNSSTPPAIPAIASCNASPLTSPNLFKPSAALLKINKPGDAIVKAIAPFTTSILAKALRPSAIFFIFSLSIEPSSVTGETSAIESPA